MSLTSSEAADELGITARQVERLAQSGALHARHTPSGRWIIDADSLSAYRQKNRSAGRRWTPEAAWAVLWELADIRSTSVDRKLRSRVRDRIRNLDAAAIAHNVASRSRMRSYRSYGDTARLEHDLILTGVSAVRTLATDLVGGQTVQGYVQTRNIDGFEVSHYLTETTGPANVILHLDPSPELLELGQAPGAVVAADLANNPDPRIREAGIDELEGVRRRWLADH